MPEAYKGDIWLLFGRAVNATTGTAVPTASVVATKYAKADDLAFV